MLLGCDQWKYLWAEAVNYVTWLKDWFPSHAMPETTPYALINKTKPSLAIVRGHPSVSLLPLSSTTLHLCKGTSVHLLTLPPLFSPILFYPLNSYSTLCICTHHHQGSMTFISNSRWPSHTKVVDCL
jgi:hypothetical protein